MKKRLTPTPALRGWIPNLAGNELGMEFGQVVRMKWLSAALFSVMVLSTASCASRSRPVDPAATPARPPARQGLASYYGQAFNGKTTASGIPFDMDAMVAAHPTFPFGTLVRVTNLNNNRTVDVRIVDRGPARGPRTAGVIIDLSQGAAKKLDFIREGRARVRVEVLNSGRAD